ncbi:MAG: hypothetical protein EPN97_00055 [Alphaproteobacteria bacterium]|nr:MAG: hypothetical protein EPN97_00055 [Alphaproteobacteria bacterium]
MYSDFFFDDFGSRYDRYARKPELRNLTELVPESQDEAIRKWAEKHNIASEATIESARKLAASRHKDVRYFVADTDDMSGSIKSALIIYHKDRYQDEATYRMALVFRDGRMALTTATYKRKEDDYKKESINGVTVAARCKRLLEEALDVHSEKKFDLRSDSALLKFPDKPDPYRRNSFQSWYLPSDLKEVTYISEKPFWETKGAYEQNFRQGWETEVFGGGTDDTHLKKISEEEGRFTRSKSFSALEGIINRHEKERFNAAWSFFADRLNPDIVKTCDEVGIMSAKAYNWLAGDGNSYRSERRIQAAQTYSLFFRTLADKEVTEAIDKAQPLKPVLAKKAGANHTVEGLSQELRPSTVQRLQEQFRPQDIMSLPHDDCWRENWSRLDALPPEWWPKTKEDIKAYSTLVEVAKKYEDICGMPRMKILQEFKGQWQAACRKLEDDRGMHTGGEPQYYYTPTEVEDYLKTLHRKLFLPVMLREADAQKVAVEDFWLEKSPHVNDKRLISDLFNDVSLVKRVELSRTWHRKITEISAAMAELSLAAGVGKQEGSGLSWAALTTPQTAPNGVSLVPLTNDAELKQEGEIMHHCVGGYGAECYKGDSAIISLRSATGEHLSTLQLRLSGEHVYSVQNKGVGNVSPSAEAAEAAEWYISVINGKKIPTSLDRIHKMKSMTEAAKAASKIVGFDATDTAACARAFEIYKPCLPKRYRDIDYDTWLKEAKVMENVGAFMAECSKRHKNAKSKP